MILIALLAAAAPAAETPRQFMTRVYASYRNPDFSPFTHPNLYFAPQLVAAMNEDTKLANDEVGYVDGDPICQCQDTAGMHPTLAKVTQKGREKANVLVSIGWDHDKARPAAFSLVRTRAGWRIADVSSADEPSFLRAIEESNRKLRAEQKRK